MSGESVKEFYDILILNGDHKYWLEAVSCNHGVQSFVKFKSKKLKPGSQPQVKKSLVNLAANTGKRFCREF